MFGKKPKDGEAAPAIQAFDPRTQEKVYILGQDAHGTTHHDYVRDKATQQIIGRLVNGKPTRRR